MELSHEQEQLLRWIEAQETPPSLRDMQTANAPGYTEARVAELLDSQYLRREIRGILTNHLDYGYVLTDKGRAALQTLDQTRQNLSDQTAQKEQDRKDQERFSVKSAVIGAVVGSILTFFFNHIPDLIEFFSKTFS